MGQSPVQPAIVGVVPPLWSAEVAEEMLAHRGRWIALDEGVIVAVADSVVEVIERAAGEGVPDPLVYRVPARPELRAAYVVQPSAS